MLDEATASIDSETDALVQSSLKEAFSECTLLIIAHRLSTVLNSDRVIVMEAGRVGPFFHLGLNLYFSFLNWGVLLNGVWY